MKKKIIDTFWWFNKKISNDHVDAFAAQSAFFIIIAIIPFLLFLLSFMSYVNINGESILQHTLSLFPNEISRFISSLIFTGYEPVAILSVSGFTCLWSASKATMAIVKGLNSVFEVKETPNYFKFRALSLLYTLLLILVLTATTVVLVFGNSIYQFVLKQFSIDFSNIAFENKSLLLFFILTGFFCMTYKLTSRKSKIPFKFCLISSALSSLSWILFSFFFSIFVNNFSNYANMYGSLATFVIFMLWLYFCMYIMLLGGEISIFLSKKNFFKK